MFRVYMLMLQNMRKFYSILLVLLFIQPVYGQESPYDSLERQLASEKIHTNKLTLLKQLTDVAFESDIKRALEYAKRGVQLSDKIGDKNWQPKFYEMEGRMHANLLQLDSATLFFNKAWQDIKQLIIKEARQQLILKWAGFIKKKEIDKAMAADLNAARLMETFDDKQGIAGAYEGFPMILPAQGLKEAMDYAKKAIAICEENNLNR